MKKLFNVSIAVLAMALFTVSCEDDNSGSGDEDVNVITQNISENTTWTTGNVYHLDGRITVLSGVTLTIEPGVIVKGKAGSDVNATALLVARGATLNAVGSRTNPIIFTSEADDIQPGQIASPNLDPTLDGLWGGVIILGSAKISSDNDTMQIEGIPPSDINGSYGGQNDADNSGTIQYVSIRHGGTNIGEGNEINGLTLGGVGSGTTIDHIEIVSNQDDGIEWFGGTVDVSDVVVWNTGDDAIDGDQAWKGTLDNFVIINPGDKCFELDGPEGTYINGNYTIQNGTVIVGDAVGIVDNDANTNVDMNNIFVTGIEIPHGEITENYPTFDLIPTTYTCNFSSFQVVLPTEDDKGNAISPVITDFFKDGSDSFTTAVTTGTVGADLTEFDSWSWAATAGEF